MVETYEVERDMHYSGELFSISINPKLIYSSGSNSGGTQTGTQSGMIPNFPGLLILFIGL